MLEASAAPRILLPVAASARTKLTFVNRATRARCMADDREDSLESSPMTCAEGCRAAMSSVRSARPQPRSSIVIGESSRPHFQAEDPRSDSTASICASIHRNWGSFLRWMYCCRSIASASLISGSPFAG
eukprot:scaffold154165_cov32-Tisochrysis_lutea.AAC.1